LIRLDPEYRSKVRIDGNPSVTWCVAIYNVRK